MEQKQTISKMTVQTLIDHGLVDFIDYKNGLYYLEFIYSKAKTFSNICGGLTEIYNYIGVITCDDSGKIYKAIVKSYCFIEKDSQIVIGFPQIINKVHNLNLNDIFKVDDDRFPYLSLPTIKLSNEYRNSTIWANRIKSNNSDGMIHLYQTNVCIREYINETQDRVKTSEFFKNEKEKFNLLAKSIITGSKNIENGLGKVAGSVSRGLGKIALVNEFNEGNSYIYHNGGV